MDELAKRLLDPRSLKTTLLEIPEVGVTIKIRQPPAGPALDLYGGGFTQKEIGFRLVVLCSFNPETDKPLFTEDDIPQLHEMSYKVITRIVQAINDLGDTLDESISIAKKNSGRTRQPASSVN